MLHASQANSTTLTLLNAEQARYVYDLRLTSLRSTGTTNKFFKFADPFECC